MGEMVLSLDPIDLSIVPECGRDVRLATRQEALGSFGRTMRNLGLSALCISSYGSLLLLGYETRFALMFDPFYMTLLGIAVVGSALSIVGTGDNGVRFIRALYRLTRMKRLHPFIDVAPLLRESVVRWNSARDELWIALRSMGPKSSYQQRLKAQREYRQLLKSRRQLLVIIEELKSREPQPKLLSP